MELRGVEPLRPACKAGIIPLDHSPEEIGRGGGSRTRTLPFMRRMLFHLSYSAILILEARGGVEPRAFPPSSCRFGLEDRRRERGPELGGDGEIRASHTAVYGTAVLPVGATSLRFGRGVRPTRLCELRAP